LPAPASNQSIAQQDDNGAQVSAARAAGLGRVIINGEPTALWNSIIQLIGCRPGVDGTYGTDNVEHFYSRQGYITTIDIFPLAAPGGSANEPTFATSPSLLPQPAPDSAPAPVSNSVDQGVDPLSQLPAAVLGG
jgi:hypothetical protein